MLTFAYPWLGLLLPLPLLAWKLLPAYRPRRLAARVPFLGRIEGLTGVQASRGRGSGSMNARRLVVQALIWTALLLSLARPQWLGEPLVEELPMRDLLLAVDLSGSMETEDFTNADGKTVNRLDAVKSVLEDFLTERQGDRVGLIVFGSAAFVQAPFTEDLEVVRTLLDELSVRMAGPKTALGDAIGLAMTLFERSELPERVLIALTDGNDTGSLIPPGKAAAIARDQGVVIYTIGVGDPANAGEDKLDETTLKAVAEQSGGRYFFAADRSALQSVYDTLDELEPRQVQTHGSRPRSELYHWPLAVAVALSLISAALGLLAAWRRGRRADDLQEALS